MADPHHAISHHQNRADNLEKIAKIGAYHSKTVARTTSSGSNRRQTATGRYWITPPSCTPAGMSDSNAHQPIDLPLAVFSPELGGGQHLRRKGVPLTNLYMTLLGSLGVPVERIGDSTGTLSTL